MVKRRRIQHHHATNEAAAQRIGNTLRKSGKRKVRIVKMGPGNYYVLST